jgi:hypothetical protein
MLLIPALVACGGARQSSTEPPLHFTPITLGSRSNPLHEQKDVAPDERKPDDSRDGQTDRWTADCAARLDGVREGARAICPATRFDVYEGSDLAHTTGEGAGCYVNVWLGPGHKPNSSWEDVDPAVFASSDTIGRTHQHAGLRGTRMNRRPKRDRAFDLTGKLRDGRDVMPSTIIRCTTLPAAFVLLLGCAPTVPPAPDAPVAIPAAGANAKAECAPAPRRTLTVALYPFLPDSQSLFFDIEHSFERAHPDVDLQIIDLSANYYNEDEPRFPTRVRIPLRG